MTNEQRRAIRQQRRTLRVQSRTSRVLGNPSEFDFDVVAGLVFRDLHRANACAAKYAPACAREMGCVCAGHARDWNAESCDTREAA